MNNDQAKVKKMLDERVEWLEYRDYILGVSCVTFILEHSSRRLCRVYSHTRGHIAVSRLSIL